MRQLILFLIFFVFLPALANTHLRELNSTFPYALLTDDFGILTKDDLKIDGCIARPAPFSETAKNQPYPHWQCFDVRNSRMICEGRKYDPDSKSRVSMLVLSGIRDGETHEFMSRRTMTLNSCRLYQKDWQKFTRNEKYICISGSDPSKEIKDKTTVWTWIFGRYKTKKGCDSYFEGECNPQYQISHNRCARSL